MADLGLKTRTARCSLLFVKKILTLNCFQLWSKIKMGKLWTILTYSYLWDIYFYFCFNFDKLWILSLNFQNELMTWQWFIIQLENSGYQPATSPCQLNMWVRPGKKVGQFFFFSVTQPFSIFCFVLFCFFLCVFVFMSVYVCSHIHVCFYEGLKRKRKNEGKCLKHIKCM